MVLEGFLEKEGSLVKSWRRRLFVLTTRRLRYHLQHSYEPQKGEIMLTDINDVSTDLAGDSSAVAVPDAKPQGGLFRRSQSISTPTVAVMTVSCPSRQLRVRGATQDIEKWCAEIKGVLVRIKAATVAIEPEVRTLALVSRVRRFPDEPPSLGPRAAAAAALLLRR